VCDFPALSFNGPPPSWSTPCGELSLQHYKQHSRRHSLSLRQDLGTYDNGATSKKQLGSPLCAFLSKLPRAQEVCGSMDAKFVPSRFLPTLLWLHIFGCLRLSTTDPVGLTPESVVGSSRQSVKAPLPTIDQIVVYEIHTSYRPFFAIRGQDTLMQLLVLVSPLSCLKPTG